MVLDCLFRASTTLGDQDMSNATNSPLECLMELSGKILIELQREPPSRIELRRMPGYFGQWLALVRISTSDDGAKSMAERLVRYLRTHFPACPQLSARDFRLGVKR